MFDVVGQGLSNSIGVSLRVFYLVSVVPVGSGEFPSDFYDFLSQSEVCCVWNWWAY